ncbi:nuclear transcription factor Y subunit A-8-like [Durio zibethinus]|uniref:Nuclear transcription factor Y subunit n=1 Tax=Durio zibethinus TaxID=66656 RepID=A0A6P5ZG38_DURZI|nr:nuclear transcription factor Y subunit A-8-like [Durio zibethinus]
MAIRVQNMTKKNFDASSLHSLSRLSISGPPWWNSNEQQNIAQSLPQNISLKVESPSQLYHNAKHLYLQLPVQGSASAQAIFGQSHHEVRVIGVTNSHCNSSESGQDEGCRKDTEGQRKQVFLLNNPDTVFSPSHSNYNHSMASAPYPCADAYFGGPFTTYGQEAIIQAQMAGSGATRIPLPFDLAEDGFIYVNAKQYHGILRRRQYRAKLKAQNKLVKSRKPYLHESRHLHALNRVRGSGGRFLSKKKIQQPDPTFNTSSQCISYASCLGQKNSRSELERRCPPAAEYTGSSISCSDMTSVSNSDGNIQQREHRFPDNSSRVGGHMQSSGGSMSNGILHCASVVR